MAFLTGDSSANRAVVVVGIEIRTEVRAVALSDRCSDAVGNWIQHFPVLVLVKCVCVCVICALHGYAMLSILMSITSLIESPAHPLGSHPF